MDKKREKLKKVIKESMEIISNDLKKEFNELDKLAYTVKEYHLIIELFIKLNKNNVITKKLFLSIEENKLEIPVKKYWERTYHYRKYNSKKFVILNLKKYLKEVIEKEIFKFNMNNFYSKIKNDVYFKKKYKIYLFQEKDIEKTKIELQTKEHYYYYKFYITLDRKVSLKINKEISHEDLPELEKQINNLKEIKQYIDTLKKGNDILKI